MFNLAVTLRLMRRFDEAQAKLDAIAATDPTYPGLALERGVLFEASGMVQKALEMYQEALSKAPNDPDLMLRVGSAEVAAGHATQAEDILRKVQRTRPNSAEVNHFLGRALLLKGNNKEALRFLQRATEIDPNRATYHIYIGIAANEANQQILAEASLERALELEQNLADAYWQRGILAQKRKATRDAQQDLLTALRYNPARFEAHAALAECYEDARQWTSADASWRKATEADGNRPFWRYKLGRLRWLEFGDRVGGTEQIKHAVQLAARETRPSWLADAYLMLADMARTGGKRNEAIEYYDEFLAIAPSVNPLRAEAIKQLANLNPPTRDR